MDDNLSNDEASVNENENEIRNDEICDCCVRLLIVEVLHFPSLTPITTLEVDSKTTLGALKKQIEEHIEVETDLLSRVYEQEEGCLLEKDTVPRQEREGRVEGGGSDHQPQPLGKKRSRTSCITPSYSIATGLAATIALARQCQQKRTNELILEDLPPSDNVLVQNYFQPLKWHYETQGHKQGLAELLPNEDHLSVHDVYCGQANHFLLFVETTSPPQDNSSSASIRWSQHAHLLRLLEKIRHSSEAARLADDLLFQEPNQPMHALWQALHRTDCVGPAVPVALIKDCRCGMECRMNHNANLAIAKEGGEVHVWVNKGTTPLIMAVLAGRLDVVAELVNLGADLLAGSERDGTAIHAATRVNNLEIVKFLAPKYDLSFSYFDESPLHVAVRQNYLEAMKLLISLGCHVNNERWGSLYHDATSLEAFALLVDHNCGLAITPQARRFHCTALYYAMSDLKVPVEAIGLLIAHGCPILSLDLLAAARIGRTRVVQLLVSNGCDIEESDSSGNRPLHLAVINEHVETVKALIELGCNIDAPDGDDKCALQLCAERGFIEPLKVLLTAGADTRVCDSFGFSSLAVAVLRRHPKAVDLLIEVSDLAMTDSQGQIPLHYSVLGDSSQAGITQKLLAHGSDVNKLFTDRLLSPLHAAAQRNRSTNLQLLLDNGGDIQARNAENQVPLDLASRNTARQVLLAETGELVERGEDSQESK